MGDAQEGAHGQSQINTNRYRQRKRGTSERQNEHWRWWISQTQRDVFIRDQLGKGEDNRTGEEDSTTKVFGRYNDVKRTKQGDNSPQRVQSDGAMAIHSMCVYERLKAEDMIYCMCHPRWHVPNFRFQIQNLSFVFNVFLFCTLDPGR